MKAEDFGRDTWIRLADRRAKGKRTARVAVDIEDFSPNASFFHGLTTSEELTQVGKNPGNPVLTACGLR
jgi:hypothetical protein